MTYRVKQTGNIKSQSEKEQDVHTGYKISKIQNQNCGFGATIHPHPTPPRPTRPRPTPPSPPSPRARSAYPVGHASQPRAGPRNAGSTHPVW